MVGPSIGGQTGKGNRQASVQNYQLARKSITLVAAKLETIFFLSKQQQSWVFLRQRPVATGGNNVKHWAASLC